MTWDQIESYNMRSSKPYYFAILLPKHVTSSLENAKAYVASVAVLMFRSLSDLFGDRRNIDRAVTVAIVQES